MKTIVMTNNITIRRIFNSGSGFRSIRTYLFSPRRRTLFFALIYCAFGIIGITEIHPAETAPVSVYADLYRADSAFTSPPERKTAYSTQPYRMGQLGLNYGMIRGERNEQNWRGAFGLHTGTYVEANYAAEPELNRIMESAILGFRLGGDWWLEGGIFASHIGNEGAIHFDLPTIGRSLIADLSPYYESGAALSWEPSDRLLVRLLYLNGWQTIASQGNSPAGGWQIFIALTDSLSLNSSSFAGSPDGRQGNTRLFHNLHLKADIGNKWEFYLAADIGADTENQSPDEWRGFGGFSFISRWLLAEQWAVAWRLEGYDDRNQIFVPQNNNARFRVLGTSITLDYRPVKELAARLEARYLRSEDKFFSAGSSHRGDELLLQLSLAGYLLGR